jgi:virulence-associated protein VapD
MNSISIPVRKFLSFDLDSDNLRHVLGGENGRKNAYKTIQVYMKKHGFTHRQGSAYITAEPMTDFAVAYFFREFVTFLPWFKTCVNKIDVTDVGNIDDWTIRIKDTIPL